MLDLECTSADISASVPSSHSASVLKVHIALDERDALKWDGFGDGYWSVPLRGWCHQPGMVDCEDTAKL